MSDGRLNFSDCGSAASAHIGPDTASFSSGFLGHLTITHVIRQNTVAAKAAFAAAHAMTFFAVTFFAVTFFAMTFFAMTFFAVTVSFATFTIAWAHIGPDTARLSACFFGSFAVAFVAAWAVACIAFATCWLCTSSTTLRCTATTIGVAARTGVGPNLRLSAVRFGNATVTHMVGRA